MFNPDISPLFINWFYFSFDAPTSSFLVFSSVFFMWANLDLKFLNMSQDMIAETR